MLAETYTRIRPSIVAFTPKYPALVDPQLGKYAHLSLIFGTGFIVDDSLIATNKHVVDKFNQWPKPNEDENDVPVNALFFTKTEGGIGICLLNVCEAGFITKYESSGHHYGTKLPDVALVSVACTGLKKYALVCDSAPTCAGTEIATAGFPLGSTFLAPTGQLERFGPVLQRGIISAESPFCDVEPHGYLIDVMVQGGASGSPVFRIDNGQVVGVLYATQSETAVAKTRDIEITVRLPTSFSYVVPAAILLQLMESAHDHLQKSIPDNVSSIDEIVDSMPKEPVDQITISKHVKSPSNGNAE